MRSFAEGGVDEICCVDVGKAPTPCLKSAGRPEAPEKLSGGGPKCSARTMCSLNSFKLPNPFWQTLQDKTELIGFLFAADVAEVLPPADPLPPE